MNQFSFHTKLDQTLLLGRRAKNILELLRGIETVPDSSIYYHTHRFLQQHHYLSPEPPNDFAYWVHEVLNEQELGEALSSIDIVQFHSLRDLRTRFLEILRNHHKSSNIETRVPRGQEFHFMGCRTFVLRTPYVAENLGQFKEMLKLVSINSIYHHVFDSKLRLQKKGNDFSIWFRDLGNENLAEEVERLDPYTYTLEGLRNRIVQLVEQND